MNPLHKFSLIAFAIAVLAPFSFVYAQGNDCIYDHNGNLIGCPTGSSEPEPVLYSEPITSTVSSDSNVTPEIQALLDQITSLLAIVETLQAQLAVMQGGSPIQGGGLTRNLTIGDEGSDVKALQEFLNSDSRTRIASSGVGSPGRETTYFGALTANAVSRFQELYASEILAPVGLSRGSGYFGPSTRAKVNALVGSKITSTINITNEINTGSTADNSSNTATNNDGLVNTPSEEVIDFTSILSGGGNTSDQISENVTGGGSLNLDSSISTIVYESYDGFAVGEASAYSGSPGQLIILEGNELTSGTKIHFEDAMTVTGTANSNGTSLTFTIPNVEKRPYLLTFTSASGEQAIRKMDFAVTNQGANAPKIFSISPSLGTNGSSVTIFGSGFTATNNQVEIDGDVISGIASSDGKSITFTVNSDVDLPASTSGLRAEWPLLIFVANANGRVEQPEIFVLTN